MSETDRKWLKVLIILAVASLAIWLGSKAWDLIVLVGDILLQFFLAWLIAFVLSPFNRWFREHGAPAIVSTVLVYLGLAVVVVLAGVLLTPALLEQLRQLASSLPTIGEQISGIILGIQEQLMRIGIRNIDLTSIYGSVIGQFQSIAGGILQNAISVVAGVANVFITFIIVLILSFYMTLDGARIGGEVAKLVPGSYSDSFHMLADSINKSFGGFLRGQMLVAVVYGILTYVIMLPAGLNYTLIISIISGIAMLIPFIGAPLAMVLPVLVALLQNPGSLWWLVIALLVLQQILLNVVSPRVMSQTVGIHPLIVFLALLLGAKFAGLWGAIFGIPIAAVITVMLRHIYHLTVLKHDTKTEVAENNLREEMPAGTGPPGGRGPST
jgi:predicted PurR-regulated permease PerM